MEHKLCTKPHRWILETASPNISEKGNLFIFCGDCGTRTDSGISLKLYNTLDSRNGNFSVGKPEVIVLDEQGFYIRHYYLKNKKGELNGT